MNTEVSSDAPKFNRKSHNNKVQCHYNFMLDIHYPHKNQ